MSETFEKISAVLDGEAAPDGGDLKVQRWHPQKTPIGTIVKPHSEGDFVTLEDHRAHVTRLQAEVAALQQRLNVADQQNDELKNAAPVCCVPTVEEKALLAAGDCTPEELWGGPRPTCPKCIGAPVPPAGVEVEVLGYVLTLNGNVHFETDDNIVISNVPGDEITEQHKWLPVVDRAHVTRLQAQTADATEEMIHWQRQAEQIGLLNKANESELTKAQELLGRVYDADLAARHHQPYNVSKVIDDIESFIAHQSAPAAKDGE